MGNQLTQCDARQSASTEALGHSVTPARLDERTDRSDLLPVGDPVEGSQGPAPHLRPSTSRRLANLRALVYEFSVRDMSFATAALFLKCSPSSARNYVFELLDAEVVISPQTKPPHGRIDRLEYRLNSNLQHVQEFLAKHTEAQNSKNSSARRGEVAMSNDWDIQVMRNSFRIPSSVITEPARRDPLVTALFGVSGLRKKTLS